MATPPKPGKPVDPVKTLKKLLRQLRNDDADERPAVLTGLTALFDAQPDAITAADDLEMLVYAAQRGNLPVVELLLARGADPTRKPGEDDPPLLAELISIRTDDPAHLEALITGLVARGLDETDGLEPGREPGLRLEPRVEIARVFPHLRRRLGERAERDDEPSGVPRRPCGALRLLEEHDVAAGVGEVVRDGGADDASADDDDAGLCREGDGHGSGRLLAPRPPDRERSTLTPGPREGR